METVNLNSLGAYIRSSIRAAGFRDLRPRLRQVLLGEDEEVTPEHRLLNHHEHHTSSEDGDEEVEPTASSHISRGTLGTHGPASEHTPLIGDRRSSNVSNSGFTKLAPLRSKVQGASSERIGELARQRDESRALMKDDDRDPLLITKVRRDDGTEAEVSSLAYMPRLQNNEYCDTRADLSSLGDCRPINATADYLQLIEHSGWCWHLESPTWHQIRWLGYWHLRTAPLSGSEQVYRRSSRKMHRRRQLLGQFRRHCICRLR